MIEYVLHPNELTGEPNQYSAKVINTHSYTFDDIAKHLIKHNTGLSSAVIYGLWEGIKDAVEEFISEGGSINTELFHAHTSIKGVFNGDNDGFDSSRHKIRLNLSSGPLLRDAPKKLKVKKVNPGARSFIQSVTDIRTGTVNGSITPGKNIRIKGSGVKIKGDDPSCGLYFIPAKTSSSTVKVELSDVVINNPSQIIAVIPKLEKGNWSVKLVTQYRKGSTLRKAPHSVTFERNLVVA